MTMTKIKKPEWLEKLPSDWTLLPVRAVLKERKEKNTKLEESNILSLMKGVGVIRYEDKGNVGNKSSERPEAYKIVRANDIVLNSMNLSIGSVGIAREDGVTSSVYIIYQARPEVADPDFYHYLFQTVPFQKHLASFGRGIMELREAVKERDIRNQPVVVPPPKTQKRIADFLDKKTKIIDELITKKERLIELLKEKRSVLITRAVTKGLDPYAKLKPSGVDWLGDIPEGWEIRRTRFLVRISPSKSELSDLPNQPVSFLPMPYVSEHGALDLSEERDLSFIYNGYTYFRNGDVILAKITPCFENGKGAFVSGLTNGIGFGSTEFHVFRPRKIQGKFLYYFFMSEGFKKLGELNMRGTAGQKRVPELFIKDFLIGVPPNKEQEQISDFLDTELAKIDEAAALIGSQSKKLKEYRSSLIYSAVTGKIKV